MLAQSFPAHSVVKLFIKLSVHANEPEWPCVGELSDYCSVIVPSKAIIITRIPTFSQVSSLPSVF